MPNIPDESEHSRALSASDRLKRARDRTHKFRGETLALVGLLVRMWPAHTCLAKRPNADGEFERVVCVHTPQGILSWKLSRDEEARFDALPMRDSDCEAPSQRQRIERIDALALTRITK